MRLYYTTSVFTRNVLNSKIILLMVNCWPENSKNVWIACWVSHNPFNTHAKISEKHFLLTVTYSYVCVSLGKKCQFSRKFYVFTNLLICYDLLNIISNRVPSSTHVTFDQVYKSELLRNIYLKNAPYWTHKRYLV